MKKKLKQEYKKKYNNYPKGYIPLKLKKITNYAVIKCYSTLCSYAVRDEHSKEYIISLLDAYRAMKGLKLKEHDLFSMLHMYPVFKKCVISGQLVGFQVPFCYYEHFIHVYKTCLDKRAEVLVKGDVTVE